MKQLKKTNYTSENKDSLKQYRVVFIDWSGTLSGSKFWGHLEKMNPDLFQKIENSLFSNLKGLIKPWMKGEVKAEHVIRSIANCSNLPYNTLFDEFLHSCHNMEYVSEDIPKLVKELQKRKVKVVIATDNMDSFTRWTVKEMKLHKLFDEVLNSHDLRGMKQDIDQNGNSIFFSEYIKKEKLKPGESILIDDSSENIEVIESFGIHYLQIKPIKGLVPALKKILTI